MVTSVGKRLTICARKCVYCVALSTCLSSLSLSGLAQTTAPPTTLTLDDASYEQAREELAILFRQLKKIRAELDESDFEPTARANLLQGDTQTLFEFVRDEVAFQPYAGVMRRAEGTLMSRAGNAYDQSLLLAALLDVRGIESRFVRAVLSADMVREELLLQIPIPLELPTDRPSGLSAMLPQDVDLDAAAQIQADLETIALGHLTEGYWYDYQLLDKYLSRSPFDPRATIDPALSQWIDTARNHCWLQAKIGGKWVDLDPTAASLGMGEALATPAQTSESLDASELTFKLKIHMELETTATEKPPVIVMERLVNLQEAINHIRIATVPENMTGVEAVQAPGFLDSMEVFQAVIEVNGTTLPGKLFNLAGELVSDNPDVRNATKMQKTQSQGFGALNSGMGGLFGDAAAKDEAKTQLTRVWLRFDIVSPSGEVRTQRRLWAERGSSPDVADNLLALKLDLLAPADIISNASNITPTYVTANRLDQLLANRSALFALLAIEAGRPPPNLSQTLDARLSELPLDLFDLHVRRANMFSDMVDRDFPSWSAWTDGPFVVMQRKGGRYDDSGETQLWESLDVLHNAVAAAPYLPDTHLAERAELSLRQGIIDTQLEFHALGGSDAVINAHSITRAAVRAGVDLQWIAPGDTTAIGSLSASENHRAAMLRDSSSGYALLAPLESVSLLGQPQFAWWRLNPGSGEILGMADRGAGGTMAEYKASIAASLKMGAGLCVFVTAFQFRNADASIASASSAGGEYIKCVIWSGIGGAGGQALKLGAATTWSGHLGRSGLLNGIMCALSRVVSAFGNEPVKKYVAGTTIEDLGGTAGRQVADTGSIGSEAAGQLGCMAVGMAIGAAGFKYQRVQVNNRVNELRSQQQARQVRRGRGDTAQETYRDTMGRNPRGQEALPPNTSRPPDTRSPFEQWRASQGRPTAPDSTAGPAPAPASPQPAPQTIPPIGPQTSAPPQTQLARPTTPTAPEPLQPTQTQPARPPASPPAPPARSPTGDPAPTGPTPPVRDMQWDFFGPGKARDTVRETAQMIQDFYSRMR